MEPRPLSRASVASRRSSPNSTTASATSGSIGGASSGTARASLMLEYAIDSNAPNRSNSISSRRVGEASSPSIALARIDSSGLPFAPSTRDAYNPTRTDTQVIESRP